MRRPPLGERLANKIELLPRKRKARARPAKKIAGN